MIVGAAAVLFVGVLHLIHVAVGRVHHTRSRKALLSAMLIKVRPSSSIPVIKIKQGQGAAPDRLARSAADATAAAAAATRGRSKAGALRLVPAAHASLRSARSVLLLLLLLLLLLHHLLLASSQRCLMAIDQAGQNALSLHHAVTAAAAGSACRPAGLELLSAAAAAVAPAGGGGDCGAVLWRCATVAKEGNLSLFHFVPTFFTF